VVVASARQPPLGAHLIPAVSDVQFIRIFFPI